MKIKLIKLILLCLYNFFSYLNSSLHLKRYHIRAAPCINFALSPLRLYNLKPFHSRKVHRTPQTPITPGTPHRLYVLLMRIFNSKVTISRYRYPRSLSITLEPFSRRNGFTVLQSRGCERNRDERSYAEEEVANAVVYCD